MCQLMKESGQSFTFVLINLQTTDIKLTSLSFSDDVI